MKLRPFFFLLILGLLTGMLLVTQASKAYACSCVAPDIPANEKRADAVALGVITDETTIENKKVMTIEFSKVYKGEIHEKELVATAIHGAACGYDGMVGKEALFFIDSTPSGLSTNLCSGNVVEPTEEDLKLLSSSAQEPLAPTDDATMSQKQEKQFMVNTIGLTVIGVLGLGFFGVAIMLLLRFRKNRQNRS